MANTGIVIGRFRLSADYRCIPITNNWLNYGYTLYCLLQLKCHWQSIHWLYCTTKQRTVEGRLNDHSVDMARIHRSMATW